MDKERYSMNEITIVGNVTADPVVRFSEACRGVLRFDVAVNRRRFNKQQNQWIDDPAVFHRVVAIAGRSIRDDTAAMRPSRK
jgi:single-strand DNA-binding protein